MLSEVVVFIEETGHFEKFIYLEKKNSKKEKKVKQFFFRES